MLCLPKITVCKTVSEVIPDTLSKLCVIPSALQTSAHFNICQKILDMRSAEHSRVTAAGEMEQQQPALPTPPFSQKILKTASYMPLSRLLSR